MSPEAIEALEIPVLAQDETSAVVVKSTLSLNDKAQWRQERYNYLRQLGANLIRLTKQLQKVEEENILNAGRIKETRSDTKIKPKTVRKPKNPTSLTKRKKKKTDAVDPLDKLKTNMVTSPSKFTATRKSTRLHNKTKVDYSALIFHEETTHDEMDVALAISLQQQ